MGTIALTTQPQAINAGGLQGDLTLFNAGPDTVYLDSQSSISPTLSQALTPLSSIVWRGGASLWAMSRGNSTLQMSDSSEAPVNNAAVRQNAILTLNSFAATPSSTPLHAAVECSNYQTLKITFYNSAAFVFGTVYDVKAVWYDSNQVVLTTDFYYPGMALTGGAVNLTIPVKGSFVALFIEDLFGGNGTNLTITGITDARSTRLEPTYYPDNGPLIPRTGNLDAFFWGDDFAHGTFSTTALVDVGFHSRGRNLSVVIDYPSAPSSTGTFTITTMLNDSPLFGLFTIAAVAVAQRFDFTNIPQSVQCYVDIRTVPTSAGVPSIGLYWS